MAQKRRNLDPNAPETLSQALADVLRGMSAAGEAPAGIDSSDDQRLEWWNSLDAFSQEEVLMKVKTLVELRTRDHDLRPRRKLGLMALLAGVSLVLVALWIVFRVASG